MYIMYTRTIYEKVKFALKGMCHRIVNHWIRTGMRAQQVYCLSPVVHVSQCESNGSQCEGTYPQGQKTM